jgi:fluoroacetyl-CoA thioesterase
MKDTLAVGIEHETHHHVTPEMAPPHLPVAVLSTPSMIQLIEMTCLEAAQRHLDDGETTVGTHVCVSHSGAARAGEDVRVRCELQAVEGRRLTFAVEVSTSARSISEGTHQRVVVDRTRFAGA